MFKCAVRAQDLWQPDYLWAVQRTYEMIGNRWTTLRHQGRKVEFQFEFSSGVENIHKVVEDGLANLDARSKKGLYLVEGEEPYRASHMAAIGANIVYESLLCVARKFRGYDDDAWFHAQRTLSGAFERFGAVGENLSPLQQRLAAKLLAKLNDNMRGYYPPICRLLLAIIGPYEQAGVGTERSAFNIFKDAVYLELRNLKSLAKENPDKLPDYLPDNVTYDPVANALTHNYRSGKAQITNLDTLVIEKVDLTDERLWALTPLRAIADEQ